MVAIRRATARDAPAVVGLIGELAAALHWESTVDAASVRRFLEEPSATVLLAVEAERPVGLLSYVLVPGLFHAGESGIIESLVVTAGRRGGGIGRRLLENALAEIEAAGCAEVSIGVDADNEAAQRLYLDAGLTEASVLLEKHFAS